VALAQPVAHASSTPSPVNGDWIAYSTAHAADQSGRAGTPSGSDVFLIREGGRPRLVAGRGSGRIWNLCPAFSPDGAMLAFARRAPDGSKIVVVGVARDGATGTPRVVLKVRGDRARCPRWSADGSRLAYLGSNGTIVVRGLDGSMPQAADGDPTLRDFTHGADALLSPTGRLVARLSECSIVVARPDGSEKRVIEDDPCSYAIAGWSPDGRKLLVMRDISGLHFTMREVSVDAPFSSTAVAIAVRVNHPRSWPGYGDVSWQPARRR
jgi:Tol biopolymer transport system component